MTMIDVQNVTKTLNGRTILNDVSFDVEEGEVFGLLGPNGAGKTTTLKILLGLLQPTSGQALVFGKPLGDNGDLRKRVGVLLEHDGLYERLSAYENLNYYAQIYHIINSREKITTLLDFVGLSDRLDSRVGEFSKGMKRRLAIARSILHDPDVLFYDEPESGLDPEAQKMVRELILCLSRENGRTVFLNSHDLDEVQRICSKIAILQSGEVKAYDTIDSLRRKFSTRTVEIVLVDNKEAEKAQDLLTSIDYVSTCERDGARIVAIISNGESSTLLNALMNGNVQVEEVKNVTKSVEEIYLNIMNNSERRR
jgi:ABC-2 type transport system ATP-binding protein